MSEDQPAPPSKTRTRKKKTGGATDLAYTGPSLAEIQALTDTQVEAGFIRLGITSKPLPWHDDDSGRNTARYATHADPDAPKVEWSAKELAQLKASAMEWHARCERTRLFVACITAWVGTLSDERLWKVITDVTGEKPSVSERRYVDRATLRDRVTGAVYSHAVTPQTKGSAWATLRSRDI